MAWAAANGAMGSMFGTGNAPKVKAAPPKKVNISAGVAVGNADSEDHTRLSADRQGRSRSGTVVLQATISKTGYD
jgi:hypothetical protein